MGIIEMHNTYPSGHMVPRSGGWTFAWNSTEAKPWMDQRLIFNTLLPCIIHRGRMLNLKMLNKLTSLNIVLYYSFVWKFPSGSILFKSGSYLYFSCPSFCINISLYFNLADMIALGYDELSGRFADTKVSSSK